MLTGVFDLLKGQHWGPATALVVIVGAVIVTAGAIVTIVNPSSLSFHAYVTDLSILAGASGLLSIGRGIHLGAMTHGTSQAPHPPTTPGAGA